MQNIMSYLFNQCRSAMFAFMAVLLLCQAALANTYTIDELPSLKPDSVHEVVTSRVTHFFTQSHFRDFDFDGVFSSKVFDRYFKLLDGNKLIFTQSDVDRFRESQTTLVDELKKGSTDTAFAIYNLSLKKRFQRYQYALSILEKPMDFSLDESIDFNREDIAWPATESELDEYWRKRVKYDALSLALAGKEDTEIKETLTKRYNRILRTLIQTNSEDAFQVFMNAFAREIDPHTTYLAPRAKRNFDSEMSLSFEGIGATLSQEDDYTRIVSFITGGPAERSGQIDVGDRIIGVGQKDSAIEDVIGWRLDDIVDKIRGKKGSIVKLEILPEGNNSKSKVIEIKRDEIHFEDREAKLTIKETKHGNVGVIDIPNFYIGLTKKVSALLSEANQQELQGIVIDLRNNGGGSLAEVIMLTGIFIEQGPVVQVKDNMRKLNIYEDKDERLYYDGPIVVMVNRYSASASEIFSAALQDYGRALIVGEETYGKGTVQTSRNIAYPIDAKIHPDWSALGGVQYTIQKFYRINGGSTQLKGVTPDIKMMALKYMNEVGERYLDNALSWDSVSSATYKSLFDMQSILPQLTKLHETRVKNDPEFNYLKQDISEYNQNKDQYSVISLNKSIREREQKESDEKTLLRMNERLERAKLEPISSLDELPKEFKIPDAYLDESVKILLDLAKSYPKIKISTLPAGMHIIQLKEQVEK